MALKTAPVPWLPTYTGKTVSILDPNIDMVDIQDIAHALSMTCRFGGQCRDFYSVAEHSLLVLDIARDLLAGDPSSFPNDHNWDAQLAIFLHDAAEAYVGDLISPLKRALPEFSVVEKKWELAIDCHFKLVGNLSHPSSRLESIVKVADQRALAVEVVNLYPYPHAGWWERFSPPTPEMVRSHPVECLSPAQARSRFLQKFFDLESRRGDPAPWQRKPPRIRPKKS